MSEESHMARPDTAGRGEARHGWARQGTELAPGVVRVDTDKDGTPIGTCWGDDLPAGWLWRMDKDEDEWVDSELDNPPSGTWWVQCRQPSTPSSTRVGDDVLDRADYWLEHAPNHGLTHDYTRDLIMDLRDALNAAESSAIRPEPMGLGDVLVRDIEEALRRWNTAVASGAPADEIGALAQMVCTSLTRAGVLNTPASPVVDREPTPDDRSPECVEAWPECWDGGYDPRCCRFPKSCSCSRPRPVVDREPAEPEDEIDHCVRCGGSGTVRSNPWTRSWKECPECYGTGDPPSVPPVPQPEPDQTPPEPPRPNTGEFLTTVGWYAEHGGGWEWRDEYGNWFLTMTRRLHFDTPVVVRRADNENPRGTD